MRKNSLLLVPFSWLVLTGVGLPDTPEGGRLAHDLKRARRQFDNGNTAAAIELVEQCYRALPERAKLNRWRREITGPLCQAALVGRRRVYLMFEGRAPSLKKSPLQVPGDRRVLRDTPMGYDFNEMIVCLDAVSGRKLWSRQTPGRMAKAVDPKTDGLYLWRYKVFRLSADSGDVDFEKELPKEAHRRAGIIASGRALVPQIRDLLHRSGSTAARLFHLQLGTLQSANLELVAGMSPDETRLLRGKTCLSIPDRKELWKHDFPVRVESFWLGGDVIVLDGDQLGRAGVARLDGQTGKPRWKFAMPRGAYEPGSDQLRDGGYAPNSSRPVDLAGDHVLAIGGDGRLFFLDPETGRLAATASPSSNHMTCPRLIDGALVVCSQGFVRAIPIEMVLGGAEPNEKDVLLLRAEILIAQGGLENARRTLEHLVQQDPECAPAWKLLATIEGAEQRPFAEVAAWCRYLSLAREDRCRPLCDRWGLVRRIPTGNDIIGPPLLFADRIFVGTSAGWLYEIDARTGRLIRKTEHSRAVNHLRPKLELRGFAYAGGEHVLSTTSPSHEAKPASPPREWHSVCGYDGRAAQYQGRYFRPLHGGGVRVLEDGQVKDYQSSFTDIKIWQIYTGTDRPLGYGTGGVYELDENLCPKSRLIDVGKRGDYDKPRGVWLLGADEKTICALMYEHRDGVMQVWTADGKRKLREEVITPTGTVSKQPARLIPLAGGYLLSGKELTWISPDAEVRLWRFGPGADPGPAIPRTFYIHTSRFGVPVVVGDLLLVTSRDGGIYEFRVSQMVASVSRRRPAGKEPDSESTQWLVPGAR